MEETDYDEEAQVTNVQLIDMGKAMKAPALDGIPSLALKIVIQENPDMYRTTLQKCIKIRRIGLFWEILNILTKYTESENSRDCTFSWISGKAGLQ